MSEAYIYDAVRTPRGRGKADGALHEVTSLALASHALRMLAARSNLPEDVVANFGLGKVLLDLERWEEALPYFRKAIERQASYSMAYNHLGTCLAHLGRGEEAKDVFRRGIEAAKERGDLIPRRDMERKLEGLT